MTDLTTVRQQRKFVVGVADVTGYGLLEAIKPMLRDPLPRVGLQISPNFAADAEIGMEHPLFTPLINYLKSRNAEVIGVAPTMSPSTMEQLAEVFVNVLEGRQTVTGLQERVAQLEVFSMQESGNATLSFESGWSGHSEEFLSTVLRLFDGTEKPARAIEDRQVEIDYIAAAHMAVEIMGNGIGIAVLEEQHARNITALELPGVEIEYVRVNGSQIPAALQSEL